MSLYLEFIPAFAAVVSAVATVYSAYKLKNKVDAEKHFISELSDLKNTLNADDLVSFQNLRNKISHNIDVSDSEISRVTEILDFYIQKLEEEDKKYINEAIFQESIKGRLRYTDKIISKMGIEAVPKYKLDS